MNRIVLLLLTLVSIISCKQDTKLEAIDLDGFTKVDISGSSIIRLEKNDQEGNLVADGYIINGIKTGIWNTYKDNNIQTITHYIDGKKNGISLKLSNRGQIEESSTFLNDKLNGKHLKLKFGKVEEEINYKNGIMHGEFKKYNRSGKLQQLVTYKNGEQHGKLAYYNEEGEPTVEYEYKDGKKVSGGIVEK